MASLESLPPDQRAVLELVLQRGRSYDQIAEMLGIDRAGVRERALSALDALGPSTGVPAERRALITDYLLGALPSRVADQVRERLGSSASERAWARVIAAELGPIAKDPLPEIPVEAPSTPARAERAAGPERPARPARPERRRRPEPAAEPAPKPAGAPRSSRRGGALLLAGAALIVAAVIAALVASSGGSSNKNQSAGTGTAATNGTSTSSTTAGGTSTNAQVLAQINLNPPSGGKAKGVAEVLRESGRTGVAIVAQDLAPNSKNPPNAYAVWLYNSPSDARILGFVNPPVGSNGRLQTAGGFPAGASHFHQLLITLETQSNPKTPGTIVLQGTLTGVP